MGPKVLSWGLRVRCGGLWGSYVREGGCWRSAKTSSSVQASAHFSCLQIITSTCSPPPAFPHNENHDTLGVRYVVDWRAKSPPLHCFSLTHTQPSLQLILESYRNNKPTELLSFVIHHSIRSILVSLTFSHQFCFGAGNYPPRLSINRKSSPVFRTIFPSVSVDILPVTCQTISAPSGKLYEIFSDILATQARG